MTTASSLLAAYIAKKSPTKSRQLQLCGSCWLKIQIQIVFPSGHESHRCPTCDTLLGLVNLQLLGSALSGHAITVTSVLLSMMDHLSMASTPGTPIWGSAIHNKCVL